jgi:formate hydrogenlyase subunit 3/multisubunit Na+/H+ antiporter MnhD subunit
MFWTILAILIGIIMFLMWTLAWYFFGFFQGEKECWRKQEERTKPPRFP